MRFIGLRLIDKPFRHSRWPGAHSWPSIICFLYISTLSGFEKQLYYPNQPGCEFSHPFFQLFSIYFTYVHVETSNLCSRLWQHVRESQELHGPRYKYSLWQITRGSHAYMYIFTRCSDVYCACFDTVSFIKKEKKLKTFFVRKQTSDEMKDKSVG